VDALDVFQARLTALRQQMEDARNSDDMDLESGDNQRLMAAVSLSAVCEFLEGAGWSDLSEPFVRIMVSLEHLASGIVDPIFSVDRGNGALNTSHTIMSLRGRIAACQEALMKQGLSEIEASTFIFRQLGGAATERLRDRKSDSSAYTPATPKTIKRWRDTLHTGKEGDSFALEGFQLMKRILVSQAGSDLKSTKLAVSAALRSFRVAADNLLSPKSS
jgi:hypothetical protein